MEFCSSCGARLILKSKGKLTLYCSKCKKKFEPSEKNLMKDIENNSSYPKNDHTEAIIVIDKKLQKLKTLPTVDSECVKCKGKKAETWTLDLGSEDNSQAIFFRCTSCGYTWRETD